MLHELMNYHILSQYSIHRKMMQLSDQRICPVLRLVQIKKNKIKQVKPDSNDNHDLSTANYTSSELQESCQSCHGISRPSHRLQVEEVAGQATLVCHLHGPWDVHGMVWFYSMCHLLVCSNNFTWDPAIPLHFGCRHMWIFITFIYFYFF